MKTRIEKDTLGERRVPASAYYGIQTLRALENFPVSGLRAHPSLVRAYAEVKRACAVANRECRALDARRARAIVRACDEVVAGALAGQFVVDVYQAGAGTSFNMNVNEVLANRALERLGRRRGDYAALHPNDHVNMSQSTNDTFPTALRVAALRQTTALCAVLDAFADSLAVKAREFRRVRKAARTHLQDAVPISLGQEFAAYAAAVRACASELARRARLLEDVPLGGTAAGTGANTPAGFRRRAVRALARSTGLALKPARDMRFGLQSHQPFTALSGALRELALELIRISGDLRLLASGPVAGLGELRLPAVQPGSSIMPGKSNPALLEGLSMLCFQAVGRDLSVGLAAQAGQLDLNVMTPLTAYDLLDTMGLFLNFLPSVEERCLRGIEADAARCRANAERTPSLAALLNPRIGYARAADVFKDALRRGRGVRDLVLERGLLSAREFDELTDPYLREKP
ncbi:MAG: aspartate ammonia-lyase [Elusimicrobiota bacterium]|jgi:aspartate ammonia-lyase